MTQAAVDAIKTSPQQPKSVLKLERDANVQADFGVSHVEMAVGSPTHNEERSQQKALAGDRALHGSARQSAPRPPRRDARTWPRHCLHNLV
jgi:hypothetical protein